MERTLLGAALALAVTASVGCKDSNPNYISFDAAPTQTIDAKGDVPPAADGAAGDIGADHGGSLSDATQSDTPVDKAPQVDAVADATSASDAADADTAADATGADGGDGQ